MSDKKRPYNLNTVVSELTDTRSVTNKVTKKYSVQSLNNELQNANHIDSLSTDAQTFFGFLTLIIDIKYRNRYGKTFDDQRGRGYIKDVQLNNVLADQVSPVNDGLLGHS